MALRDAGCVCTYACDISQHARKFYSDNYQHVPDGDITKADPESLTDFEILCAGFPCQSFSLMGKRRGLEDETNGHMFNQLMRFVKSKSPCVVILENVKGLLSVDEGRVMEYITKLNAKPAENLPVYCSPVGLVLPVALWPAVSVPSTLNAFAFLVHQANE